MTKHQFEFKGTAQEYFGIWIVNVLLSIVTLGIYGAWAKVRDKKYMATHTQLDGQTFDYHATGKQILIGRVIVVAVLVGLSILSAINPILYLIGILALLCLLPFIVVRSLRFNARVSSYRNVRFDFVGRAGQAFVTYVLIPVANVFTLYLCSPFVTRASQKFVTNNGRYGDRDFKFNSDIGPYYAPFFIAIAIVIGGFVLLAVLLGGGVAVFGGLFADLAALEQNGGEPSEAQIAGLMGLVVAMYAAMFLLFVPAALFYRAWVRNVHLNNTVLDERHQLRSTLHPGRYIWIVMSNAIVSLCTFGLMIPWARIRLAKYMASVTALESEGSLDGYTSQVQDTAGVISSEYMDMEGFDIDIGL